MKTCHPIVVAVADAFELSIFHHHDTVVSKMSAYCRNLHFDRCFGGGDAGSVTCTWASSRARWRLDAFASVFGGSFRAPPFEATNLQGVLKGSSGDGGGLKVWRLEAPFNPPSSPLRAPFKPPWSPLHLEAPFKPPLKPPWRSRPWSPLQAPFKPPFKPPSSPLRASFKPPSSPLQPPFKPPSSPLRAPLQAPLKPPWSPLKVPTLKPPSSPLQAPFVPPSSPLQTPFSPPSSPLQAPFMPSSFLHLEAPFGSPPGKPRACRRSGFRTDESLHLQWHPNTKPPNTLE